MKGLIDLASLSPWRDLSIYQCLRLSSQPFLTGIVEKFPRTIHFTIILHISFLKDISISLHFEGKMNFVTEHSRPTLLPRSQLHTIIYRSPNLGECQRVSKKEGSITLQLPSVECFPDNCISWPSQVYKFTRGTKEVHSHQTRRKIPCLCVKQHCF